MPEVAAQEYWPRGASVVWGQGENLRARRVARQETAGYGRELKGTAKRKMWDDHSFKGWRGSAVELVVVGGSKTGVTAGALHLEFTVRTNRLLVYTANKLLHTARPVLLDHPSKFAAEITLVQLGLPTFPILTLLLNLFFVTTTLEQKYSPSIFSYEYYFGFFYFPYRPSPVRWREDSQPACFLGPRGLGQSLQPHLLFSPNLIVNFLCRLRGSVRTLKRIEHERQRLLQRKIFEDQMRALEQQQARELLNIPVDPNGAMQHLAASAPTTPPRVNAVLNGELSPGLGYGLSHSVVDADVLSKAVGFASDKRKSVTYAPSVTHSPEMPSGNPAYARPGAKSMPASRRTSASEHDEELAGHLQGLSLAGERAERVPTPSGAVPQSILRSGSGRYLEGQHYGNMYNAGMMLDEQLDQEMHNAMRNLPTSDEYGNAYPNKLSTSSAALDLAPLSQTPSFVGRAVESREKSSEWPQFNGNPRGPDGLSSRTERRTVTNPALTLSPSLNDLSGSKSNGTMSGTGSPIQQQLGQGLAQGLSSRRGSPLGIPDGMTITTARSVPATPLPGMPNSAPHLAKTPGTPLTGDAQVNGMLHAQIARQLSEDSDLNPSLSRIPSGHFDGGHPLSFSTQYDSVYGLNGGLDGARYNPYGFEGNGRVNNVNSGTGSTALYHHHGSRYGLGLNGRPNGGADGKMNGLHGPKHKRGDIDREFNRFAGTRLEDLQGEIPTLCKDQHGCRYLQKKLEEGVPEHRDMIFRETFGHFADLMTDPFGNYLCQKLLEYSTDEQRNVICESVAQDLVNISLNMHGTRAVQKMIDFLSTRRQASLADLKYNAQIHSIILALSLHVVVLIKDLNGNHVIQKCLNKLAPEDNQFIYNAVAANCVEVATHRHGCCVLQRCVDHASDHQRIQLVNEITYNALTLVQDPYGNYVVQYILDLNDNRFSDAVIRQFTGNVCALSVQKFSSNVIEKCIRVAEHSTRKMLIGELLNRTRLEKLLRDSYGNYCVQTALDYAEASQRALLVEGIRPVLPLIRNTPYGKRIQNKLQREHLDGFGGGYHPNQQALVNMALGNQGMGMSPSHTGGGRHMSHLQHASALADAYTTQNGLYALQGAPTIHAPALHSMQSIDSYVMQGSNSPGLTPPHTHAGAFSNVGSYGSVNSFPIGVADPYQRSFGYGM
ncbi:Pumilio domain-containing protein C6G9.14 [Grifola frondosa]|uniref:Pumilio domain-containing protein C6G9.14 n=1 Tax=Grifola frondosa TaxID=5627 RepID=A0A1C7MQ70_GRIFR|nr:Pumilio domain-containing protein C6G9.14 [Grifola frondosa]